MSAPQRAFPVAASADDPRFATLVKRVGHLVEELGFGRPTYDDRVKIGGALFGVLYSSGGAAGELERRLNGTAAPLVSDEGKIDAYDCTAAAHELRRVRGAEGAIVIAVDPWGRVHVGMAVPEETSTQMDRVAEKVMNAVVGAVPTDQIEEVVLDIVVKPKAGAS